MHSYSNYQWDESYPQEKDFVNDIHNGDLFVAERNRNVVGFVCVNKIWL
jgi:hypothetical protein